MGLFDKMKKKEEQPMDASSTPGQPSLVSPPSMNAPLAPGLAPPEQGMPTGQVAPLQQGEGFPPVVPDFGQPSSPLPGPMPGPPGPIPMQGGGSEALLSEISSKLDRVIEMLDQLTKSGRPPIPRAPMGGIPR